MKRFILIVAVVVMEVSLVSPASAQTPEYETVLLPVAIEAFSGAFGSQWITDFTVYNGSSIDLDPNSPMRDMYPLDSECGVQPPCPPIEKLRAKEVQRPRLFLRAGGPPGVLLHVKRPFLNDLSFNLRVQDTSRQALSWGTEIPVVRESELRTTTIVLLNVPLDSRFRQALRVYDPDSRATSIVRLRIFAISSSIPLVETTLTLQRPPTGFCVGTQEECFPSYAEVQNLPGTFPALQGHDTVNVEIESLTPGLRFWSFISITNNDTQHVTTMTPQ